MYYFTSPDERLIYLKKTVRNLLFNKMFYFRVSVKF